MKSTVLSLCAALCFASVVSFGADPLGAPKASLEQGQFGLALEYSYTEMKLMREFRGVSGEYQIDQLHTTYLTGSYGVTPWLELFARVGMVDMDASDSSQEWVPGPFGPWLVNVNLTNDYDFDQDMIYGAGAKVTLGCVGDVTFGAVASYSWAAIDGISNRSCYGWFGVQREAYPATMDAEMQQIQVVLGAPGT